MSDRKSVAFSDARFWAVVRTSLYVLALLAAGCGDVQPVPPAGDASGGDAGAGGELFGTGGDGGALGGSGGSGGKGGAVKPSGEVPHPNYWVNAALTLSDGSTVVAGKFTEMVYSDGSVPVPPGIARLKLDYKVDPQFDSGGFFFPATGDGVAVINALVEERGQDGPTTAVPRLFPRDTRT
ncbi:hypothetical protein JYT28_01235 [Desulfobulbus sp. AH-315-M07]|nr:hypothetical protein [Desulfobulbus sp. AH-315-M07]